MLTIWCLGGLGNQMFQYAMYRALELDGHDVKLDTAEFDSYALHNGYELERVFSLIPDRIVYKHSSGKIMQFIMRVMKKLNIYHYFQQNYYTEERYEKQPPNLNEDTYLHGYWQSEKYFIKHRDAILKDFNFPPANAENKRVIDLIAQVNSVSLHVRRGDYINHSELGGICDLAYYQKAIAYIREKVANPHFFVFSNDLDWCKDNLPLNSNVTYVDFNTGEYSFRDMQLMSLCKHNIVANSSFSWWGAWLNVNPDKIVITPSRWFNNTKYDTTDIIPHSWYKIN